MIGGSIKEHVVEFVPGTGIITDGVANSNSTFGPWNWNIPFNILESIRIDAIAGGSGGGGGGNVAAQVNANSSGGGTGGGVGAVINFELLTALPGETLTITVGAGGSGGGPGQGAPAGGGTSVQTASSPGGTSQKGIYVVPVAGGGNGATQNNGTSAPGGNPPRWVNGSEYISNGQGPATGPGGIAYGYILPGFTYIFRSSGGGAAANANGAIAGANGGAAILTYESLLNYINQGGLGTTDGTISYGGGGAGASILGGIGGSGGNGEQPGGNGGFPGGAGGGGGGNAAGGSGADGYVRIRYRSLD
jgi:hypothetical protein